MNQLIFCSQDLFADLEGRKEIYREDVVDTWDGMLSLEEIQQVCYSDINGVLYSNYRNIVMACGILITLPIPSSLEKGIL